MIANDSELLRAQEHLDNLWRYILLVSSEAQTFGGLEHLIDEIEKVSEYIEHYKSGIA
jgi:hypothetical protein